MLNFSPAIAIYLHAKPIDMRKSFDSLYGIIKNDFDMDVRNGGLFLFINLRRNRIKLLYWDVDGMALWMKRLERGSFQHPQPSDESKHLIIDSAQLNLLLSGIELSSVKKRKRYVAPQLGNKFESSAIGVIT
jgi:transposase